MGEIVSLLNGAIVFLFGVILSFSFSGCPFFKNKIRYVLACVILLSLQAVAFVFFGKEVVYKIYPVLIHLSLFFIIAFLFKKDMLLSAIAVLSAYLFCTPRKWIGTFISCFFGYDVFVSEIVQILISVPFLFVIIKYIAPIVHELKNQPPKILRMFIIVPLVYYIIEYALTVYTDLLYTGGAVVIEFMDAAIVVLYFLFTVGNIRVITEKARLESEQELSNFQLKAATNQLEALRESEKKSAIYRHDLVHHMNFLDTCITQGLYQEAQSYISETCEVVKSSVPIRYVENESVNLILCSLFSRAKKESIDLDVEIGVVDFSRFQVTDICALFSNSFMNAVNANNNVVDKKIIFKLFEKNDKVCISIRNTFGKVPVFEGSFPVNHAEGHGVGVKSIVRVLDKYNAVYDFSVDGEMFVFQSTM